jgi:hypothetical protein
MAVVYSTYHYFDRKDKLKSHSLNVWKKEYILIADQCIEIATPKPLILTMGCTIGSPGVLKTAKKKKEFNWIL